MRKITKAIFVLLYGFLIFSCDDIFEEDISENLITAVNPLDGDIIEGNTVQFLWDPIEGADDYTIQVYSNNFLFVDSTVTSPPFQITMNTGSYEWRIKGLNFAYQTQFNFPNTFQVIASIDLTNQMVVLQSPSENIYTNNNSIIFTWNSLENADNYSFELQKVNSTGNTTVFLEEGITSTSIALDNTVITEDAEYLWRVKATNTTSETSYSSRSFFLDTVAPATPSLITPEFEEEFLIDEEVNFSWNFEVDSGIINSPITSVYEISSNSNFSSIIESGSMLITNFNYTFNTIGTYYWRVRGEDEAGNIGSYNLNGKVIINE